MTPRSSRIHETAAAVATKYGGIDMAKLKRPVLVEYMARHSIPIGRETDLEAVAVYCRLIVRKLEADSTVGAGECTECKASLAVTPELESCPICGAPFEGEAMPADERTLDETIQQIKAASISTAIGYWTIGREVLHLFRGRLYQQRIDPATEKPKYRSWSQFVRAELPFSETQAKRMMTLALVHTRETISKIGSIRKLELLASVPEGSREELIERVRSEGTSFRMLEGTVRKMFPAAREPVIRQEGETRGGNMRRIPPGERAPRAERRVPEEAPEPTPAEERVTAVVEPGVVELKLKKLRSGTLVAMEDGLNGIETTYEIDREGKTLKITRKRT